MSHLFEHQSADSATVGDVVTTPILPMLKAIASSTLQDDVYREDPTTSSFERHIADLTGHEAGMFVLSGTMGNQIALRTHLMQPPHSVLCDARSHIIQYVELLTAIHYPYEAGA